MKTKSSEWTIYKFIKTSTIFITAVVSFFGCVQNQPVDIKLDMSNPKDWTVDVVHLGSKQIEISYDTKDDAVVMQPTWSASDASSTDVSVSNVENGRLHSYQLIKMSDCTQSEVRFEISIPQEYIDEGKWNLFSPSGKYSGRLYV
ncbi:MAG: hypothetical protein IPF54_00730 [Draconibacterium sp.]|nr:hypothetical protein [Draconibacterium sp.]